MPPSSFTGPLISDAAAVFPPALPIFSLLPLHSSLPSLLSVLHPFAFQLLFWLLTPSPLSPPFAFSSPVGTCCLESFRGKARHQNRCYPLPLGPSQTRSPGLILSVALMDPTKGQLSPSCVAIESPLFHLVLQLLLSVVLPEAS